MEVEHKCENCYHEQDEYCCNDCYPMTNNRASAFAPKEAIVRQDERSKIVDILDMDLEEAKKVLAETLKSTDKEQLYKDLVSSCLLVEKEK